MLTPGVVFVMPPSPTVKSDVSLDAPEREAASRDRAYPEGEDDEDLDDCDRDNHLEIFGAGETASLPFRSLSNATR